MTTTPKQERILTILETILFAVPDVSLKEALDNLAEISKRVDVRLGTSNPARAGLEPEVQAAMLKIDESSDIQDFDRQRQEDSSYQGGAYIQQHWSS